jgi:hypothetical protein
VTASGWRRALSWCVATAIPSVGIAALLAPPDAWAASLSPSAVGWWDTTKQPGAPGSPEPDVPAGGGLVSGINPGGAASPAVGAASPDTAPVTTAVTALRFTLPAGSSATTLTLTLAATSTNTSGAAPLACLTTAPWSAGDQQAGPGPTRDCAHSSLATSNGTSLIFNAIGQLQQGTRLDVVIVPSVAGRLVIQPPTAAALQTIGIGAVPAEPVFAAPPVKHPERTPATRPAPAGRPAPVRTNAATAAPVSTPAEAPAAASPRIGSSAAPTVAAAPPPTGLIPPGPVSVTAVRAVRTHQTHRTELLLALTLLVALAAVLFALDPDSGASRAGAAIAALRRKPLPTTPARHRGVGRHRCERTGRAPAL